MRSWWTTVTADRFADAAKARDEEMRSNPQWRKRGLYLSDPHATKPSPRRRLLDAQRQAERAADLKRARKRLEGTRA